MIDRENNLETITLRTMRLENTRLGTGSPGITVRGNLHETMIGGKMMPAQTSKSGETIVDDRGAGVSIDGSSTIKKSQ